jgi:hypothetical protein
MTKFDGEKFGTELSQMICEFVAKEIGKLRADLELRFKMWRDVRLAEMKTDLSSWYN